MNMSVMRKIIKLSAFLFLIFSSLVWSGTNKHIFWEVQSDSATVYLLGSIHVGDDNLYPLDTVIENNFSRCDYLVVEVDMNKINPFDLIKKAYYQGEDRLKNHLSKEVYQKLKSEFDKLNIKESFYEKMKPWFAVITLTNLKLSDEGYESQQGIDLYFLEKAKKENKEVKELETADFQIELLDSVLGDLQDNFVLYSMEDIDSADATVDDMFRIWKSGDATALDSIANVQYENMPNADEFKKAFVYDRNIAMANKITEFLKTGKKYFVVVGAAHLVGERGIVRLLEEKNLYKIQQK